MADQKEHRRFIRHPTDIPVWWKIGEVVPTGREQLRNISEGGLALESRHEIPAAASIEIHVSVVRPEVSLKGNVVYCRPLDEGRFEVGVRFTDQGQHFKMRMVEQVCHIEHYRKEVLEKEGRTLTSQQAASEWIERFAEGFPQ